jgi:hypothetical protein
MRKHASWLAVALCLALLAVPSLGHAATLECSGYGDPADSATVVFGGCSITFYTPSPTTVTVTLHSSSPNYPGKPPFSGSMDVTLAPRACGDRFCERHSYYLAGNRIQGGDTLSVLLPSKCWTVFVDTIGVGAFQVTASGAIQAICPSS